MAIYADGEAVGNYVNALAVGNYVNAVKRRRVLLFFCRRPNKTVGTLVLCRRLSYADDHFNVSQPRIRRWPYADGCRRYTPMPTVFVRLPTVSGRRHMSYFL